MSSRVRKANKASRVGLLCSRENHINIVQATASHLSSVVADGFDLGDVWYHRLLRLIWMDTHFDF
jgi:hypothetical protein